VTSYNRPAQPRVDKCHLDSDGLAGMLGINALMCPIRCGHPSGWRGSSTYSMSDGLAFAVVGIIVRRERALDFSNQALMLERGATPTLGTGSLRRVDGIESGATASKTLSFVGAYVNRWGTLSMGGTSLKPTQTSSLLGFYFLGPESPLWRNRPRRHFRIR
jgi:hypothetical protein